MIIAGLLFDFFLLICLILYIIKQRKIINDIISALQRFLEDGEVDENYYEDNSLSDVYFLLKRISDRNKYLIDNSNCEKESIKQNISNMSHQLKTPLADILLYEELLDDESLQEFEKKQVKERLIKQTKKIQWIMESIIKCTQLEKDAVKFSVSKIPLIDTLISAINSVAGKAESKKIEFVLNEIEEDIFVVHNKKWTAEVFENIFENAIKYSPMGSQITIQIEKMDAFTKILVRDSGIGIRKNEQEKIFKRFYRSKDVENQEGSGLGLYLCRLILENEKGGISVKSKFGQGCEFCVMLRNDFD